MFLPLCAGVGIVPCEPLCNFQGHRQVHKGGEDGDDLQGAVFEGREQPDVNRQDEDWDALDDNTGDAVKKRVFKKLANHDCS